MYFLPESPRWLVANDRQEEALRVLAKLHAGGNTDDLYVQAEYTEIMAKITYEKQTESPSYISLLFGENARRMWIGIGAVSLFHFSAILVALTLLQSNSFSKSLESTCKY